MNAADALVFWILAFPLVPGFFLAYGVIEDAIKTKQTAERPLNQPKLIHPSSPMRLLTKPEQPAQVRGYDTSEMFRSSHKEEGQWILRIV
jgi:hypothetical protein